MPSHRVGDDEFSEKNFKELVDEARAGEPEAIGRLIESSRDYLLLIANQGIDPDIRGKIGASDIVQESILTAQANIGRFRGDTKGEWLAWLKQILINDLRESRRTYKSVQKRSVRQERSIDGSAPIAPLIQDAHLTPRTHAVKTEEMELLLAAIAELPEDQQQIIKLRNWEHLSYEEIGQRLNRSPDAVRKMWGRAVLKLKDRLSRSDPEPPQEAN